MIVGVVVVALVAIFFLARAVFSSMEAGETYTVPRVVGYTVDEARKLPEVAGIFEITETKSVYDNSAVGTILEQDPPENMPKKSNLIINVTVSAGVKTDNMPDLTGKTAQEAKIALKNFIRDLDLKVETKDESNDDVTTNCVIRTEPEVNAPLKKGDTVTLIISTGPNKTPVTVISFLSLPIDKAKEQATAMGLKVTQKDVESGEAAGTVIDQDIPANSKAYVGDTITLSVSKGPADTQSPGNGAVVTKPATFSLPQDGRETVHMVVLVNGVSNYEGNVNCSDGSATVDVSGTGIGSVQVYYDGVLFETRQVDFNA